MSAIGPDLPPHLLAKRKRKQGNDAEDTPATTSGANGVKRAASPDEPEKRRKVVGPAMPPAPLDERPAEPANTAQEDSEDSDDDFGPALPGQDDSAAVAQAADDDEPATNTSSAQKLKRDDWMMMPPEQDDLAARKDPTKQRPKAFNTGKGARGPNASDGDNSTWHETPEQKQKRLQDEMMGISKPSAPSRTDPAKSSKTAKDEAAHRKILEHNEKRGPSLLEQHRQTKGEEAEDDPSKRAFDREKDMASSSRVSSSQKREMLNKAAGFSGKFSGGSYL